MVRSQRRAANFRRRTRGTEVVVEFQLDGSGCSEVDTPFDTINMLLEMMTGHGGMDLRLTQRMNQHADEGYAIDDLATAIAEGIKRSLGPRPRIRQFGSEILPVGDVLVIAAIDIVSPPLFSSNLAFDESEIEGTPTELIDRLLSTLADRLGASIHLHVVSGENEANKVRATFLALGRAIANACEPADREGAREVAQDIDYEDGSTTASADDLAEAMLVRQGARAGDRPRRRRRRSRSDEGWTEDDASSSVDVVEETDEPEQRDDIGDDADGESQNGRRRRRGRRGGRGRRRSGGVDRETVGAAASDDEDDEDASWIDEADAVQDLEVSEDVARDAEETETDAETGEGRRRTRRGRRGRGRGRPGQEAVDSAPDAAEARIGLLDDAAVNEASIPAEDDDNNNHRGEDAEDADGYVPRARSRRGRSRGGRSGGMQHTYEGSEEGNDEAAETASPAPRSAESGDDGILDFVTREPASAGARPVGRRGPSRGGGGRRRR